MTDIPSWLQDTLDNKNTPQKVTPRKQKPVISTEPKGLSVSQINAQIKSRLEQDFSEVLVRGEISNFTAHRSGHYYFSLKDDKSQISAVMFRGFNSKLKFQVENGMQVLIKAKISLYEPRGTYQLMCMHMEPIGEGALQKAFEQLKAKLSKEGLFDKRHKKSIPKFPNRLALITSPTGAAIRDILNVLSRRAPGIEVLLIPAQVQGDKAEASLLKAMQQLKSLTSKIDAVIIGRGGGSSEDLWCFNSEALAREVYACKIPIVAAVGHEIDFTIVDFVADLRAPTPSAAAELIAASSEETLEYLKIKKQRLLKAFQNKIKYDFERLKFYKKALVSPQKYLEQKMLRVDDLEQRIFLHTKQHIETQKKEVKNLYLRIPRPNKIIQNRKRDLKNLSLDLYKTKAQTIKIKKQQLQSTMQLLDSLSPLKVLDRGYTITLKEDKVIKQAKHLKVKDKINIKFADKSIAAEVTKT